MREKIINEVICEYGLDNTPQNLSILNDSFIFVIKKFFSKNLKSLKLVCIKRKDNFYYFQLPIDFFYVVSVLPKSACYKIEEDKLLTLNSDEIVISYLQNNKDNIDFLKKEMYNYFSEIKGIDITK